MLVQDIEKASKCTLSLLSPAKVNLFFRVLYKRVDGFHEIASLYQAISLCDRLYFSFGSEDRFTSSSSLVPLGEENLILKALQLFRKKTGKNESFHIHLEKNIPIEAGLGGGSSNAATALYAFMKLTGEKVDFPLLRDWASEIGSDVPFFFSQGSAYMTGRGELCQEISALRPFSLWIAKPHFGLSTPKVYGSCHPHKLQARDPKNDLERCLAGENIFYNDLELAAFSLEKRLFKVQAGLKNLGFTTVVLSGSGTAFFCLGEVVNPSFPGVTFFNANTIQRSEEKWYELS